MLHTARFIRATCLLVVGVAALLAAAPASAQVQPCPAPAKEPPADSPPLYRCVQFVFHPSDVSVIDPATYQYYLKAPWSQPSQDKWVPYNDAAIQADFWNLWRTNFLDNLWVEVIDEPYDNGVMGKHVIFHMEERARVKMVDYIPANPKKKLQVDTSKIEETLRDRGIQVRLDSFVDQATIRRVKGVITELYGEKGYMAATVTTTMTELAGGPKLVHLTFTIDEGPKVEIGEVVFDGNKAFSDGKLRGQMKDNKPRGFLSFITGGGPYQEAKFADDAQKITEYYQDHGYYLARVGTPQIETIRDNKDGTKRWIRLRIPVDEGDRYRVGKFAIAENKAVKTEALRPLFKVKEGDWFSAKKIKKGMEKAKEIYGTFGFMDFNPFPDMTCRDRDPDTCQPTAAKPNAPPIVDITMQMDEGKQYFVNRITFTGNTTTHDSVIRREMRVAEGGLFNTEALKESIRRLNQLGYFKPLEGKEGEMTVTPTPGQEAKVDLKLKFEEQNRNQLAFGAGVSQFDGFFGQVSFQTANFLGRGETVGVSLQKGSQARNYQVSFSEPYMFDRPVTAGIDVYSRQYIFPLQYTQQSTGTNLILGLPMADYTRLFLGYSYEQIQVKDINPSYLLPEVLTASPYLRDSLLIDQGGRRTVSKVSPSLVFNTVNQPIFPSSGTRYTLGVDIAGIGGNTSYVQTTGEAIWYIPFTPRTSLGLHVQSQYIRPYGQTKTLPIFEKFFLGGEYSVRGFDIRSIGPRDPVTNVVIGGNKSLLFNAEYYINMFGPVRLVAFYDAGEVRDIGQSFGWKEDVLQRVYPAPPLLYDPNQSVTLVPPGTDTTPKFEVAGQTSAFKTSTGLEVRFFMPVLNVPFRLIAAYNPQRMNVLTNNLLPQKRFTFRFAVGTTF